jgi:hypothetical protein
MLLILARIAGVFISATSCTAPTLILVVVHTRGFSHVVPSMTKWSFAIGAMVTLAGSSSLPVRWTTSRAVFLRLERRRAMLAGLVASFFAHSPVYADEFDVLAVYSEARPLNDDWQTCAASFARDRLRSSRMPELLAKEALERCNAREDKLNRFLVAKVGRNSTESVMTLLHDKYQSGLAAAITELRTRS